MKNIWSDRNSLAKFDETRTKPGEHFSQLHCIFLLQSLMVFDLSPDQVFPYQQPGEVWNNLGQDPACSLHDLHGSIVKVVLHGLDVVVHGQLILQMPTSASSALTISSSASPPLVAASSCRA